MYTVNSRPTLTRDLLEAMVGVALILTEAFHVIVAYCSKSVCLKSELWSQGRELQFQSTRSLFWRKSMRFDITTRHGGTVFENIG